MYDINISLPEPVLRRCKIIHQIFCELQAIDPKILSDKERLQEVLKYHVVPDMHTCSGLYNDVQLDTLYGKKIRINEYSTVSFFATGFIQLTVIASKYYLSNIIKFMFLFS